MVATAANLGPFSGGLVDSSTGENIKDDEVYELVNLEVEVDGTLVNRPAIRELPIVGGASTLRIIGKYLPENGAQYLVATFGGAVRLIDANSGTPSAVGSGTLISNCCVQYANRLWVIPSNFATTSGGYFEAAASGIVTWTAVAAIPKGEATVVYKDRIFVAAGLSSTSNTTRIRFSDLATGTTWGSTNFFDVSAGDGQKVVDMLLLANDIVIFKEDSTWRFSYSKLPAQGELIRLDGNIGVPNTNCAVSYNNNIIYVIHGNSVYELFNSGYTKISKPINLSLVQDVTLYPQDQTSLSIFKDRLFVRYYSAFYVFSLLTEKWSKWVSNNRFGHLTFIATAVDGIDTSVTVDTAFSHSASTTTPGKLYFFRDDRTTGVGTSETFDCRVATKIYDFGTPHLYKAMWWGGVQISTSGILTSEIRIPNSSKPPTWDQEAAAYVWDDPGIWDDTSILVNTEVVEVSGGDYARRFIKCFHNKIRFRQAYFTFTTPAVSNLVADTSVKISDMVLMISDKQLVTKETN